MVDEISMDYLYNDGDNYFFMDISNFEQTALNRDTLGDSVDYLTPNLLITVEFFDGSSPITSCGGIGGETLDGSATATCAVFVMP